MARLLTLLFSHFFVKTFFFKNIILPAEGRGFLKNKKTTKNNKKQMARLLTYDGQVIDPTAYIYIYIIFYFICFHAVKLLSGPSLAFEGILSGPSRGYYLVQGDFWPVL